MFDLSTSYNLKNFTIFTFLIFTVAFFLISYILFYHIFHLVIPSLLISMFFSVVPYNICIYMSRRRKKDILKSFPTYVLSLKNYTDVDNNIIYAFAESTPSDILKKYIDRFNISVSKGVSVYTAFEQLKDSLKIKEISRFLTLLQNCYLNGGNFSYVIEKYSKFQSKVNINKEKEANELLSSKITLVVLILLNVMLLFGFVLKNDGYREIILGTVSGRVVLCLNIITYFAIYLIYIKILKMEE